MEHESSGNKVDGSDGQNGPNIARCRKPGVVEIT